MSTAFGNGRVPHEIEEQTQLIREIKEFKVRIQDVNSNLDEIEPQLQELKTRFIEYEVQESANLANFDVSYLRDRMGVVEYGL